MITFLRSLGVLRRVKHMLPLQARLTLYNSLVLPLFDYGDIKWGDKNNFTLMENLQTLQNKAAKIILDHHPQSSATEALDSLGWKPLHLRRRFHRCTTIFKCLHGFIDLNFHFVRNSSIHNYNTRSRDDFHLPFVRTEGGKGGGGGLDHVSRKIKWPFHFSREIKWPFSR